MVLMGLIVWCSGFVFLWSRRSLCWGVLLLGLIFLGFGFLVWCSIGLVPSTSSLGITVILGFITVEGVG